MVARSSTFSARRYASAGRLLGLIAIAIGVGGVAFMAGKSGNAAVAVEQPRAFVPEFNVVEVPVPDRPVPAGTILREVPVRFEKFPRHQLPHGVVLDVGRVRDFVTLVALPGGLPILDVNVGSAEQASNPIIGRIPPGMRAMTVRVDATAAVEGWARSGSIVDVLLVEKNRTSVVAEQVKVISTERSLSAVSAEGDAAIPNTVTLLVTQEQCLAINTAVSMGKIAFALRSGADADAWRSKDFDADDLSQPGAVRSAPKVQGAISVGSGASKKSFALVDGKWIPADDVPSGFFVGQKRDGGRRGDS